MAEQSPQRGGFSPAAPGASLVVRNTGHVLAAKSSCQDLKTKNKTKKTHRDSQKEEKQTAFLI